MARFEYCEGCCEKRRALPIPDSKWSPCNACIEGREQYRLQLQCDRAFRSHLARQIAGYPCAIPSHGRHHPPDYKYFQPPTKGKDLNQYGSFIQGALKKMQDTALP